MGYLTFWLSVVGAFLLWTALCTALASRFPRMRRLLVCVSIASPLLVLGPLVVAAGYFEFVLRIDFHWLSYVFSAMTLTLVGSIWILRKGLTEHSIHEPEAATWSLRGLSLATAMFIFSGSMTLAVMDWNMRQQAVHVRDESRGIMLSLMPQFAPPHRNAARFYLQAIARMDADLAALQESSPLVDPFNPLADAFGESAGNLLLRHAETLRIIRHAMTLDNCWFDRDWSRPSVDMLLPEIQGCRNLARLLSLSAKRHAAEGQISEAMIDIACIKRLADHVGFEPLLICSLVSVAIDTTALTTLASVLPSVTSLKEIDAVDFFHIINTTSGRCLFVRSFLGEEAFGLSMAAGFLDGTLGFDVFAPLLSKDKPSTLFFSRWLPMSAGPFFRVFFMPQEIASYKSLVHQFQKLSAQPISFSELKKQTTRLEKLFLENNHSGLLGQLIPSFQSVFNAGYRSQSFQQAAYALLAATRYRIENNSLPNSLDLLKPEYFSEIPPDPFADKKPLLLRVTPDHWSVYSVGPNGVDDGGPPQLNADQSSGNDDVGLQMTTNSTFKLKSTGP